MNEPKLVPSDGNTVLITQAKCCRTWPIAVGYKIGRCKICGEVPRIPRDATFEKLLIARER